MFTHLKKSFLQILPKNKLRVNIFFLIWNRQTLVFHFFVSSNFFSYFQLLFAILAVVVEYRYDITCFRFAYPRRIKQFALSFALLLVLRYVVNYFLFICFLEFSVSTIAWMIPTKSYCYTVMWTCVVLYFIIV